MKLIVNELMPVYETDQGNAVVDARELHEFLEVGKDFSTWIKDRIQKYGFVEGEDFSPISVKTQGRPMIEYVLKLDAAKELCMVENNEKGREARKHFIEIEKRYKSQTLDISRLTPEMQMFKHLFDGVAKMQLDHQETQKQLAQVNEKVEVIQETFLQRDEDWRKSINAMLNSAAYRMGGNYQDLRAESYRQLEERAHCKLTTRLKNLVERLEDAGATKTQLKNTNRMTVIESDPKLKEIYTSVVKELNIGSMKVIS